MRSLQLSIFCVYDQQFAAKWNCVLFCFFLVTSNLNIQCFIVLFYPTFSILHNGLLLVRFSYVLQNRLIVLVHLISTFLFIRSLLLPYAYVPIASTDYISLSSLAFNAIFSSSSVNTLCFSLVNPCCDFNINLLLFINSL